MLFSKSESVLALFTLILVLLCLWTGYTVGCPSFTIGVCGSVCSGQLLSYECTTNGPVATVWQGSAFDCMNNNILLRHSLYTSPDGVTGSCSNGIITGSSIGVKGNCFTSRLDIVVSPELDGLSVQCTHNNGQALTVIGSHHILIVTDPYPPPSDVHLTDIQPGKLTFSWELREMSTNCLSVSYMITVTTCGIECPDITNRTTVICTRGTLTRTPCIAIFTVQTVVCDNIRGNSSIPLHVTLKELIGPVISCIPKYSATARTLISISTMFEEIESFMISDGIEGSASSYVITYANSISGQVCGCFALPASLCVNRTCKHTFVITSSLCPTHSNINVTVYGVNQLGNGSLSNSVTIDAFNYFIEVDFDFLTSSVHCKFLRTQMEFEKLCSIAYSPRAQCMVGFVQQTEGRSRESLLTISLPTLPYSHDNLYCYVVTAIIETTFVIEVEGEFNAGCNTQQLTDILPLPINVSCGEPLYSLAIKNGIVCYGNIDTGSAAVYFCYGCNSQTAKSPHVRTCLSNGTWNGTIPVCTCDNELDSGSSDIANHHPLTLAFIICASLMGLIIAIITVICVSLFVLIKMKSSINRQANDANVVYEDIRISSSAVESQRNIAYAATLTKL